MDTERKELQVRSWVDLPADLLCKIVDGFGLIDLLSLRGVCKGWRSGLSTCSAEMESAPCVAPSFLLNLGEGNFNFYYRLQKMKMYTVSIPELKDTNCLASSHGWLLISRGQQDQDSVFFFCPLTRAKIDLPTFPHPDLSGHVAAFSAPPTSPECVLAVLNRTPDSQIVELHMLRRGGGGWREVRGCKKSLGKLTVAFYVEVDCSFNLVDEGNNVLEYSMKEEGWAWVTIVNVKKGEPGCPLGVTKKGEPGTPPILFSFWKTYESWLDEIGLTKSSGWEDKNSMCICGTSYWNNKNQVLVNSQFVSSQNGVPGLQGIWFHPRLHNISPNFQF